MSNTNHATITKKQERIFVNTFWHDADVRAKIMAIAESEGIVPSQGDVEAGMKAKMAGHTVHDHYMC